jgi:hypothetical protein
VDTRDRHIGSIASQISNSAEVNVDVGAIIRRLILFDHCTIESILFKEMPVLISLLGAEGFIELLNSGSVEIICDAQTAGQVGQTAILKSSIARGGPLPLGSYRLVSLGLLQDGPEREKYIHDALQEVNKSPISIKQIQKVKHAILDRMGTYPVDSFRAGIVDTQDEILNQNSTVWDAIRFAALKEAKVDIGRVPRFTSEQLADEGDFRIDTNLVSDHGLPVEQAHKIVERGILAAAGLNQRLRMMASFNAITGFQREEFPLFEEKLSFIARQVDPEAQEVRFERVVTIGGLPDVEDLMGTGGKVDVTKLLKIRDSNECRELRDWIRNVDAQTDAEIQSQFESVRSRLASLVGSKAGKSTRFLITTGSGFVPVVGPIASPLLSAADQFMLERIVGKPGPATFLSSSYKSIFG